DLLPGRVQRLRDDGVIEAAAAEEAADPGDEALVVAVAAVASLGARELGRRGEVVDVTGDGVDGADLDAAPEELVAEHPTPAGRHALAVFDPGGGELGVIQQARAAQALNLLVDR